MATIRKEELGLTPETAGARAERETLVNGHLLLMPNLYLGPSWMGGYALFAYRIEGGVKIEGTHIIFGALGAYDNGHKVNDHPADLSVF